MNIEDVLAGIANDNQEMVTQDKDVDKEYPIIMGMVEDLHEDWQVGPKLAALRKTVDSDVEYQSLLKQLVVEYAVESGRDEESLHYEFQDINMFKAAFLRVIDKHLSEGDRYRTTDDRYVVNAGSDWDARLSVFRSYIDEAIRKILDVPILKKMYDKVQTEHHVLQPCYNDAINDLTRQLFYNWEINGDKMRNPMRVDACQLLMYELYIILKDILENYNVELEIPKYEDGKSYVLKQIDKTINSLWESPFIGGRFSLLPNAPELKESFMQGITARVLEMCYHGVSTYINPNYGEVRVAIKEACITDLDRLFIGVQFEYSPHVCAVYEGQVTAIRDELLCDIDIVLKLIKLYSSKDISKITNTLDSEFRKVFQSFAGNISYGFQNTGTPDIPKLRDAYKRDLIYAIDDCICNYLSDEEYEEQSSIEKLAYKRKLFHNMK